MTEYQLFCKSVIGANHIKNNKECQDYSDFLKTKKVNIIAVADGHGSDECVRSFRGAVYAVKSAINVIKEFSDTITDEQIENLEANENGLMMQLKKSIITNWNLLVSEDNNKYPFSDEELALIPQKYIDRNDFTKAYGTTLIVAAIFENFWFAMQIGDGSCIKICKDGSGEIAVEKDKKCFLNETTSICDSDALIEFHHVLSREVPDAVFAGSDGIEDSYPLYENVKSLTKLYYSICSRFAKSGIDENEIENFLKELTSKCSGDDVSMAGIIKLKAFERNE